jgi:hypothetical protein
LDGTGIFEPDAVHADMDGDGGRNPPNAVLIGGDAIRAHRRRADAPVWTPIVWLTDGPDCFVEGMRRDAGLERRFVASVQVGRAGSIRRWLCMSRSAVPAPSPVPPSRGGEAGARDLLERYFAALQSGDFAAAAACFTPDCWYSHPPYSARTAPVEYEGREALAAGFAHDRGITPVRQRIVRCVQRGPTCFVEGLADGIPGGGTFLSSVILDELGLVDRYVAYYAEPRVSRR